MSEEYDESKSGKPNLDTVNPVFLASMARVLEFGDRKHGVMDWMHQSPDRLYQAAQRHMARIAMGEMRDPETGESHFAHVASGMMMLDAMDWDIGALGCSRWDSKGTGKGPQDAERIFGKGRVRGDERLEGASGRDRGMGKPYISEPVGASDPRKNPRGTF